jgi:hypothetical protein
MEMPAMKDKDIQWIDSGREPKGPSNPGFPNGINLNMASRIEPTCFIKLPYPAKRVGHYLIKCKTCGWSGIVTTAGRPDDPRSIKVPCKMVLQ